MQRRDILRALGALALPGSLAACGGGGASPATAPAPAPAPTPAPAITSFSSEKAEYQIGERPQVLANYTGGTGRLEPGNMAITSGQSLVLPALSTSTTYRLIVSNGAQEVSRELSIKAVYRNSWRSIAMPIARSEHVALAAAGGVLVIGGEGMPGVNLDVLHFDMNTETFRIGGALLTGRTQHTATLLGDGSVLVFGGNRQVSGTPIAERYDPISGKSRATAGQPQTNRTYHTATLLADGRVLIAGGITQANADLATTLEIYDPRTDQFSTLTVKLQQSRWGHVAMPVTNNLLMLYAGVTRDGKAARPEVIDVGAQNTDLLNPPIDTTPRLFANAVKRANGDWAVIGGETLIDSAPLPTIVSVGVGGISIQTGGDLRAARSLHASATLGDGRVLITGGTSSFLSRPIDTTEIHTPGQTSTVEAARMTTLRMRHSATALPNGKVLVVGGLGNDRLAIASAEIYS